MDYRIAYPQFVDVLRGTRGHRELGMLTFALNAVTALYYYKGWAAPLGCIDRNSCSLSRGVLGGGEHSPDVEPLYFLVPGELLVDRGRRMLL